MSRPKLLNAVLLSELMNKKIYEMIEKLLKKKKNEWLNEQVSEGLSKVRFVKKLY